MGSEGVLIRSYCVYHLGCDIAPAPMRYCDTRLEPPKQFSSSPGRTWNSKLVVSDGIHSRPSVISAHL